MGRLDHLGHAQAPGHLGPRLRRPVPRPRVARGDVPAGRALPLRGSGSPRRGSFPQEPRVHEIAAGAQAALQPGGRGGERSSGPCGAALRPGAPLPRTPLAAAGIRDVRTAADEHPAVPRGTRLGAAGADPRADRPGGRILYHARPGAPRDLAPARDPESLHRRVRHRGSCGPARTAGAGPRFSVTSPREPSLTDMHTLALALVVLFAVPAQDGVRYPPRPGPREFILDEAKLIGPDQAAEIRILCEEALNKKKAPIIVVTLPSLAAYGASGWPIERYALNLMSEWGVGWEDWNYGMLLLVSPGDRKARIELGASWARRKDDEARRLMSQRIIPNFKQGEYSKGILE